MADDKTSLVSGSSAKYGSDVPVLCVNEDSAEQAPIGSYSSNGFVDEETENCSNSRTITDNFKYNANGPFSNSNEKSAQGQDTRVDFAEPTNGKCFVTVEPIIFLHMLATSFQMVTTTNLMIDRICTQKFYFSEDVCQNYTGNKTVEDLVQTEVANYGMYKSLIETIPGVIFSFFIGSWSDRHGRRFPIISPLVGGIGNIVIMIVISSIDTIPIEYLFFGPLLIGLSGGSVSLIMGVFSYVSDITTERTRTKRIMLVDLALFLAMPIGLLLSGIIYKYWGFIPIFAVALGIQLIALLYAIFFLPETVTLKPENGRNVIRDMFDIDNVTANIKLCCKKRKDNGRAYINFSILSIFAFLTPLMGESSVMLLFVNKQFGWDQETLSYYSAYSIIVSAVGVILIFRFILKRWKVDDVYLVILGAGGVVLKNVITAFSYAQWMLYLASSVTFFQFVAMPVLRSFMSKLVPQDEQGRLFAVIASTEAVVPVFTSVVYTQVYKLTKDTFAGGVFLMSAGIMITPVIMYSWIGYDKAKRNKNIQKENLNQNTSPTLA